MSKTHYRPQTGPSGYNQGRNHQTFEVPLDAASRYCNGESMGLRDGRVQSDGENLL